MEVTDQQVLSSWKSFFSQNRNWKDLHPGKSTEASKSRSRTASKDGGTNEGSGRKPGDEPGDGLGSEAGAREDSGSGSASRSEFGSGSDSVLNTSDAYTYAAYKAVTDTEHLKKIKDMPIRFLLRSGEGFFVKREGFALALSDDLSEVIQKPSFAEQLRDVIEYRTMDYYKRKYMEERAGAD